MTHFVYRLTFLKPFDERIYYVGKHSGNLNDLKTGKYKTSSKIILKIFDINLFKIKIVKICKTSKEAVLFESKYHKRLNVKNHKKFFNQNNQELTGNFDRTGMVTVIKIDTNERMTIPVSEYDKNIYKSLQCGKVMVYNKLTKKFESATAEEFKNNENLVGVNKGILNVIEKKTGKWIKIKKEDFDESKHFHYFKNHNISVYDYKTKTKKSISKDEYENNRERYVGIKHFTGESVKKCNLCGKMISASNIKRHVENHFRKWIWINDNNNFNSFKVLESDFYLKLKDSYYIISRSGKEGYVNGVPFHIRKVGWLNKNLIPKELQNEN